MLGVVQRGDRFLVLELGLRLQLSFTSGRRLDGSHVSIARKNFGVDGVEEADWVDGSEAVLGGPPASSGGCGGCGGCGGGGGAGGGGAGGGAGEW